MVAAKETALQELLGGEKQYLVNKWNPDRYTKLQPTQAERAPYLACSECGKMNGSVGTEEE